MKSSSDRDKPHCAVWCGQVKLLERRRAWISVSDKKDFRPRSPASPHCLSAPQTPFPSLHRDVASHQASLSPSPCGFHLNACRRTQPTLSDTEKLVRCFLGCFSLFYSSFVKFLVYVFNVSKLTWMQEVSFLRIDLVCRTPQKKRSETDEREDRISPSCLYNPLIT